MTKNLALQRLTQTNTEQSIIQGDDLAPEKESIIENKKIVQDKKTVIKKSNKKEITTIHISSDTLKLIRIYSKFKNESISSIIEKNLEDFIKKNKVKEQIREFME